MPAYLSPIGNSQIVDANGNPLNGGKIKTFLAGTTTPADAYTTSAGTVLQTNPIILNSLGWSPNPLFLKAGVAYKIIFEDSAGVQVGQPFDNITGINDPSQVALSTPEWMPATFAISYVSGTVFSAAGDQTLTLPAGMRVKTTNTGGIVYSRVLSSVFSLGFTTVTVLNDSLTLDSGLSALSYSILSPTKPSLPNSQAARDSLGIPNGVAKNLLKNANFSVNQDGYINFTPLAASVFGHDCWRAGAGGCTYASTGGLQDCNITAGTLIQTVESPPGLRVGDKLVLSGFSGIAQLGSSATAIGVSPLIYTYNGDPTIFVSLPVGYHQKLQLEIGTNPTSFEIVSPQQNLAECQRYYENDVQIDVRCTSGPASIIDVNVPYKVTKASIPTITQNAAGLTANVSSVAFLGTTKGSFRYEINATTANADTYIVGRTFKVNARI